MPLRLPPMSALYSGPVHLNALGSALLACAVAEHLARCGGAMCGGAAADGGGAAAATLLAPAALSAALNASSASSPAANRARYEQYCRPLQRAYSQPLSATELLELRRTLDFASAHGPLNTFAHRGAAPAEAPATR